ncbi:hypothetical protein K431DRAFT_143155 [Polychaeton citri CBS 116435]|uniref:Uncharacterized protein n=1 Tax=Polychaeton citri CBS 116435 TaxID=1314669 RepID=A0A9P4Q1H7_9PEZI|nr:hypothetical protein K431DRAFT_143155 [Polychaeton citri CBS 116435]
MPGVRKSPDAFSQVKRAFKGMFRRSKKPKQTQIQSVPQQSQPLITNEPNNAAAANPTSRLSPAHQLEIDPNARHSRISDKPPQLDNPISTGSPFTADPPATDRLAPTATPTASSATREEQAKKPARTYQIVNLEQKTSTNVSPSEPASATTASAGEGNVNGIGTSPPVSAVEDSSSMRPPTAGGVRSSEDNRPVSSIESSNLHKVDEKPHHIPQQNKETPSTQQADPPVAVTPSSPVGEQLHTSGDTKSAAPLANGTAVSANTATTTSAVAAAAADKDKSLPPPPPAEAAAPAVKNTPAPAPATPRSNSNDEKMAVLQEIPDIQKKNVAPGMSATSGPLEDFFPEAAASEQDGAR